MALGGGSFTTQNKVLPGTYINFVSTSNASATLSDRGYASMGLELDWGVENEIFEVTNADFQKNSLTIFGYEYTHDKLKGLRDLFINSKVLYAYRLNGGTKASCEFGTAKYSGIRGNDLRITITQNTDDDNYFDVSTLVNTTIVDTQTVMSYLDLIDNDYISFDKKYELEVELPDSDDEIDIEDLEAKSLDTGKALDVDLVLELYEVIAMPLTGGANTETTTNDHQNYLNRAESFSYNILGVITDDSAVKQLYTNFTKRMRDEVGIKFQLVLHDYPADHEGVINVKNNILDEGYATSSIVYYVVGLQASCEINKSCLNKTYLGEFKIDTDYTQSELTQAIKSGEFVYHSVGYDVKVLNDINSLVSLEEYKGEIFQDNQTVRVIDQFANDIAYLFNDKYLGIVSNSQSGRISLRGDIVKYCKELEQLGAIEDFASDDIEVSEGDNKKAVVVSSKLTVVNAMAQLYMSVTIE